ncbi:MAG: hypothetical protein K2N72_04040 [Oscillospiraceae bacterium]|nr:hypothetical protein [Oscillospiraceae bacterium]
MFQMTFSACAFERLHCVYLRCECGNEIYIDTDNFKEVTETYVILKKNAKVTCPKCGKSQPRNERFIPQEPQIIRNAPTAKKSKLPFWMTREATTEEIMRTIIADE